MAASSVDFALPPNSLRRYACAVEMRAKRLNRVPYSYGKKRKRNVEEYFCDATKSFESGKNRFIRLAFILHIASQVEEKL